MQWATWCTDDLCGLLDFCNETEVMSVADALVSTGMKDLGYNLVLVSFYSSLSVQRSQTSATCPFHTQLNANSACSLMTAGQPPTALRRVTCSPIRLGSPLESLLLLTTFISVVCTWASTHALDR